MALMLLVATAGAHAHPLPKARSLVCPDCGTATVGASINDQYCGVCKVVVSAVLP